MSFAGTSFRYALVLCHNMIFEVTGFSFEGAEVLSLITSHIPAYFSLF